MRQNENTSPDERKEHEALLERIASSTPFSRATRMHDFLLFVGRRALSDPAVPPNEQEIGTAIFGRSAHYDTGTDNIVRVNASEVRRRLQTYFATEGAHEPVMIEMPRGGYQLIFKPRVGTAGSPQPSQEQEAIAVSAAVPGQPTRSRKSLAAFLAGCVLLLILGVSCAYLSLENRVLRAQLEPWKQTPCLNRFWSDFFGDDKQVDVVLADATYALSQDLAGRESTLADYLNYNYLHPGNREQLPQARREDFISATNRNNGSVGDFLVARQVLGLAPARRQTTLNFARTYTTEQIRLSSAILIGSRESKPLG